VIWIAIGMLMAYAFAVAAVEIDGLVQRRRRRTWNTVRSAKLDVE